MGLTYVPRVRVEGPGATVINSRLTSWERVDAAGVRSDQVTMTVDTAGQPGLPQEGAELRWFEGFGDNLVDKGKYKITRIVPRLFPPSVTILATAAPWQVDDPSGFKERRTRTFTDTTLGSIFRDVAAAHGFSVRVAPELDRVVMAHVDQVNETDSAFLTRLARERDAVAKPVDGLFVLAKRGQIKTITGKDIPPFVVSLPQDNNPKNMTGFINCQLDRPSRIKVSGVKAKWSDTATGDEFEVQDGEAPFKSLRQLYTSEPEALQACRDELSRVKRNGASVRMELPGDPSLVAEGLLRLDTSFPEEMAGDWSIDKVTARGDSRGGYRCSVIATQPSK